MAERVLFVDEHDRPIGAGHRKEAWEKGLYTRNVRVMLCDQHGRVLSQKRTAHKDLYAGMWTVAGGGHVDEGETWETAAVRETREELGIDVEVKLIGSFKFIDDTVMKKVRQFIRVYEGVIDSNTRFKINPDEVERVEWYTLDELKSFAKNGLEELTPSFQEILEKFY